MISPEYCVTLATYNAWMNAKLYVLCAGLSDAERQRDRGAFFGSIYGTLNHIFAVDEMMLEHFTSGTPSYLPEPDVHASFEALQAKRAMLDTRIARWAGSVSADWLAERLLFEREGEGEGTVSRGFWVTHWFNHQIHHRGQITTLLHQLGHDLGSTDLHQTVPSPATRARLA